MKAKDAIQNMPFEHHRPCEAWCDAPAREFLWCERLKTVEPAQMGGWIEKN